MANLTKILALKTVNEAKPFNKTKTFYRLKIQNISCTKFCTLSLKTPAA